MTEKLPKATHKGPLKIGEIEIQSYVLEDGRRVLSQSGMLNALGMSRGSSASIGGDRLAKFVDGKILKPFIDSKLVSVTVKPILFRPVQGFRAYGYEATILADICEAVLAAKEANVLQKQQLPIAKRAEVLLRGFARVGIIALVDEATGYQEDRDKMELHRILEAYIAPELLPWTKRFPDEFYKEMFRLWGWQYSPLSVKRPLYVGKLTNQLVYNKLPRGVLPELKRITPIDSKGRYKARLHQSLTDELGVPHLEKQLTSTTTLMRVSPNKSHFLRLFRRAFDRQLEFTDFDNEDKGEEN